MKNQINAFNNDFDTHEQKYINELESENYDMKRELSEIKRELTKRKSNVKTQLKELNLVILH